MSVQTEYRENLVPGIPGALVNEEPKILISRNVEDECIPFGAAVMRGDDDEGCVISDGTAALGVAVFTRSVVPDPCEECNGFKQFDSARIMVKGVVWVISDAEISAGDAVHLLPDGQFSNAGGTAIDNARWDSSAEAGGLAKLRLGSLTSDG